MTDLDFSSLGLTEGQKMLLERTVESFRLPKKFTLEDSDLLTEDTCEILGENIRLHHSFSREPFTKDKFEYALEQALLQSGHQAKLARKGNPGYDISIDGCRVSLKTQADKKVRIDELFISKWMELGKGQWRDQIEDLRNLVKQRFFPHLENYDRIFSLRCIQKGDLEIVPSGPRKGQIGDTWHYELVEIPKALLKESIGGEYSFSNTKNVVAKSGYCKVLDDDGSQKFQLYFDGAGERKLQVQHLQKIFCRLHATWAFKQLNLASEQSIQAELF